MKSQTYFRLALFLPYILWGICALILVLFGALDGEWMDQAESILLVLGWVVSIYAFGILFWFIPYTLLAVALWIWSIHKQAQTILRVFAASPLLLAVLMIVEINLFTFDPDSISSFSSSADTANFWGLNGLTALITLAAGYTCVGIGYGLYRLLQRLEIIRDPRPELTGAALQAG